MWETLPRRASRGDAEVRARSVPILIIREPPHNMVTCKVRTLPRLGLLSQKYLCRSSEGRSWSGWIRLRPCGNPEGRPLVRRATRTALARRVGPGRVMRTVLARRVGPGRVGYGCGRVALLKAARSCGALRAPHSLGAYHIRVEGAPSLGPFKPLTTRGLARLLSCGTQAARSCGALRAPLSLGAYHMLRE